MVSETYKVLFFLNATSLTFSEKSLSIINKDTIIKSTGREAQEGGDMGTYVCIRLIHFGVKQKLTQYCEAIILQ